MIFTKTQKFLSLVLIIFITACGASFSEAEQVKLDECISGSEGYSESECECMISETAAVLTEEEKAVWLTDATPSDPSVSMSMLGKVFAVFGTCGIEMKLGQ